MPKEGEIGARLVSGALILEFVWQGDRFLQVFTAGERRFTSTEDSPFDNPVYQEVHQQAEVVFASGASGSRQWSASVEIVDAGFRFDAACRTKAAASPAAWAYVGDGCRLEPLEKNTRVESKGGVVWLLADDGEPAVYPHTMRCRYTVTK